VCPLSGGKWIVKKFFLQLTNRSEFLLGGGTMKIYLTTIRSLLLTLIFFLIVAGMTEAQDATGRIVGNVTDPSGAVILGAKVTVTNEATKVSQSTITDKDGFFQVLALPIGYYRVIVEIKGFRKQVFEHQSLQINQSLRLEARLEIGQQSELVEVTEQATTVETVNATLGQSVTSRPLVNLPLNGRNVLDLALLQPGVTEKNPDAGGAGTFSVAGGRPDSITYLLDGGINNEIQGNGVVLNPNPDTIAEFRILTSNYTAEYGRNGAGVISVVTKSGTNSIHGSAFEFLRNGDFNANAFFNKNNSANLLPRDDLKRNQFGGTLGGPISIPHVVHGRDRFFFFVAYQGQRLVQSVVSNSVTTFTPAELQGDYSQAVPNGGQVTLANGTTFTCATPSGCPDPNVSAFLQANPYFQSSASLAAQAMIDPTKINPVAAKYIATGLIPTSSSGVLSTAAPSTDNNNEITGKLDFLISQKDRLTLTLGGFRNPQLAPYGTNGANVPGFPSTNQTNNYFGNVAYSRTFSTALLNEFRFTAQRKNFLGDKPAATVPSASSLGFGITPDLPNGPPILSFDSGLTVGLSPQGPRYEISNAYNYTDTITWVKGHHTWKFGAGLAFYQNNTTYDFYGDGIFSFLGPYSQGGIGTGNSFADFLLGIPNNLFEGPNAVNNLRSKASYGFVQDEWRLKTNFTLSLGLRYEYNTPKLDTAGRTFSVVPGDQSTRFPNAPLGLVFPGDKGAPRGANFPDKDNFAPRIGFAWDPGNNGKTSIRGGFGIFYDILKGEDNLQFNGAPPFYSETGPFYSAVGPGQSTTVPYFSQPWTSGGFAQSPFPSLPPTPSTDFVAAGFLPLDLSGGVYFVDPHLHTPYTYQYNLSLERELAKNLMAEISYVGSSSKGLTALVDINPMILGAATATRVLNVNQPNAEISGYCAAFFSAADCPFASEPEFSNVSFANYNSLEASLTKRVGSSRFFGTTYFTLAYTYGHSIDNASGFRNRTSQVPAYDIGQFRGSSDFDIKHRITASGGWDLPFEQAWKSGPKPLLSGWSLYPIFSWRTGFPLNISSGYSLDPSLPGPSGAGDGFLSNAVFVPGVNNITILNPKTPTTLGGTTGNFFFDPTAFSAAVPSGYGLSRNFFRGPGRTNLDLALAKTTQIKENLKLEFRVEAFNVFNHTEFANPDTNINSLTFGQVTTTTIGSGPAAVETQRILQLALRLSF